jgi:undecaprenyl pyrophosphate phosphatase UppP
MLKLFLKGKLLNPVILIIFVQILIESFPVSSSGHVALLEKFLSKFGYTNFELPDFFDHFLHGPTILVIMVVFWKEFCPKLAALGGMLRIGLLQNSMVKTMLKPGQNINKLGRKEKQPFALSEAPKARNRTGTNGSNLKPSQKAFLKIILRLFLYLVLTTFIAGMCWIAKPYFKNFGWYQSDWALLFGFCLTGGVLFVAHTLTGGATTRTAVYTGLNRKNVVVYLILGLAQGMAFLFPGLSRFAAVYATARILRINPRRAFEITFLIQMPLIIPGFVLGLVKLFFKPNFFKLFTMQVNFVFLLSTVLAYFALLWMQRLAYSQKLWRFGFYMLLPVVVTILLK